MKPSETKVFIPLENKDQFKPPLAPEEIPHASRELVTNLQNTGSGEIYVRLDQVVDLIGEEEANKLAIFYNEIREARPGLKPRTVIPKEKQVRSTGYAGFDRDDLVASIERLHNTTLTNSPQGKPFPDAKKVATAKKAKGYKLSENEEKNLAS